jgi:hypothetical protein
LAGRRVPKAQYVPPNCILISDAFGGLFDRLLGGFNPETANPDSPFVGQYIKEVADHDERMRQRKLRLEPPEVGPSVNPVMQNRDEVTFLWPRNYFLNLMLEALRSRKLIAMVQPAETPMEISGSSWRRGYGQDVILTGIDPDDKKLSVFLREYLFKGWLEGAAKKFFADISALPTPSVSSSGKRREGIERTAAQHNEWVALAKQKSSGNKAHKISHTARQVRKAVETQSRRGTGRVPAVDTIRKVLSKRKAEWQ